MTTSQSTTVMSSIGPSMTVIPGHRIKAFLKSGRVLTERTQIESGQIGDLSYVMNPSGADLFGLLQQSKQRQEQLGLSSYTEGQVRALIAEDGTIYAWDAFRGAHYGAWKDLQKLGYDLGSPKKIICVVLSWAVDAFRMFVRRTKPGERLGPILRVSTVIMGGGPVQSDRIDNPAWQIALSGLRRIEAKEMARIEQEMRSNKSAMAEAVENIGGLRTYVNPSIEQLRALTKTKPMRGLYVNRKTYVWDAHDDWHVGVWDELVGEPQTDRQYDRFIEAGFLLGKPELFDDEAQASWNIAGGFEVFPGVRLSMNAGSARSPLLQTLIKLSKTKQVGESMTYGGAMPSRLLGPYEVAAYMGEISGSRVSPKSLTQIGAEQQFVLQKVRTDRVKPDPNVQVDQAQLAAAIKTDFRKMPPIVLAPDYSIIGGLYHWETAKLKLLPTVLAYVGQPMNEAEEFVERIEVLPRSNKGFGEQELTLWVNPSMAETAGLIRQVAAQPSYRTIRGMYEIETGDTILWNASQAVHHIVLDRVRREWNMMQGRHEEFIMLVVEAGTPTATTPQNGMKWLGQLWIGGGNQFAQSPLGQQIARLKFDPPEYTASDEVYRLRGYR